MVCHSQRISTFHKIRVVVACRGTEFPHIDPIPNARSAELAVASQHVSAQLLRSSPLIDLIPSSRSAAPAGRPALFFCAGIAFQPLIVT